MLKRTDVDRVAGFVILFCVGVAVIALGGMEPRVFPVLEVLVFGAALLWVLFRGSKSVFDGGQWKGPAILLAYIGIQGAALFLVDASHKESVLRMIMYCCAFWLISFSGRDSLSVRNIAKFLIALAVLEAGYGLIQYFSGSPYILGFRKSAYLDRATGTYVNPNHFAGFLAMVVPLALSFVLYHVEKIRDARTKRVRGDKPYFVLSYLTIALFLWSGIIVSQSRLGIIASMIGVALTIFFWASTRWRPSTTVISLAGMSIVLVLVSLWIGVEPVAARFEMLEASYLGRQGIWMDTLEIIKSHPWLGTGLGSFRDVYTQHQTVYLNRIVNHAHNDYLEFAVELGVTGAVLVFGLIGGVLWRGLRYCRRYSNDRSRLIVFGACGSIVSVLVHSVGDFNLQIPANALVLAVILALVESTLGKRRPTDGTVG